MTLWSGRFDTEPDPAAFDFGISFNFDRALFEDDVTGSLAWAEALGASGGGCVLVIAAEKRVDNVREAIGSLGQILPFKIANDGVERCR